MITGGDVTTHTAATVAARAAAAATDPTPAQIEAGTYRKAHLNLHGLRITIENPKGSTRSGTAPDGTRWESTMTAHYGYVKGTEGPDGDHIDVFIGPDPASEKVYVVDQIDPKTGDFDEHKAVLGCNSTQEARRLYLSNYEPGWMGLGAITPMPMASFKAFCRDRDAQQHPLALPWASDSTLLLGGDYDEDEPRDERGRWSATGAPGANDPALAASGPGWGAHSNVWAMASPSAAAQKPQPFHPKSHTGPVEYYGSVLVDGTPVHCYEGFAVFDHAGVQVRVKDGQYHTDAWRKRKGEEPDFSSFDLHRHGTSGDPAGLAKLHGMGAIEVLEHARQGAETMSGAASAMESIYGRPSRWRRELRYAGMRGCKGIKDWDCAIVLNAQGAGIPTMIHELHHSFSKTRPSDYAKDPSWEEGLVQLLTERHTGKIMYRMGRPHAEIDAVEGRIERDKDTHPYAPYVQKVKRKLREFRAARSELMRAAQEDVEERFLQDLLRAYHSDRSTLADDLIARRKAGTYP